MTKARFTVNGKNRKGLLYVGAYGASEFLIYNSETGVALLSQAQSNPFGIDTMQLETVTNKKVLYSKLDRLLNRGYKVYSTFNQKGCTFITTDYKRSNRIMENELSK